MEKRYEFLNFEGRSISAIYHSNVHPKPNFNYLHWHESPEFIYIHSRTVIYYNGEELIGNPGDIIVINSNVIHSFKKADDDAGNSNYDCLILDVNLCKFFGFDVENNFLEKIITDNKAQKIVRKIIDEITNGGAYYVSAVQVHIGEFLLYLYRNYSAKLPSDTGNKNIDLVKKIISFAEENFKNNITLDEIASFLGYNKFYLVHTFKKATGITLLDFINTIRIKEAINLLKCNNMSINEIALASGFENQSYFSKVFKKYTGVVPSKYIIKTKE